jgi:hypothetical protein
VFAVVVGTGWVAGEDGVRRPVAAGDREAVVWSPGEVHESGSDDGMLVVIVESRTRPNAF